MLRLVCPLCPVPSVRYAGLNCAMVPSQSHRCARPWHKATEHSAWQSQPQAIKHRSDHRFKTSSSWLHYVALNVCKPGQISSLFLCRSPAKTSMRVKVIPPLEAATVKLLSRNCRPSCAKIVQASSDNHVQWLAFCSIDCSSDKLTSLTLQNAPPRTPRDPTTSTDSTFKQFMFTTSPCSNSISAVVNSRTAPEEYSRNSSKQAQSN